MTTPYFASILDEAPTEVIRKPPLPVGTYLGIVGSWEDGDRENGPFGRFPLRLVSAMEDVDAEELEAPGGLEGRIIWRSFWDNEAEKLDDFHEHCGLDLSEKASRRMRNQEVVNAQVLVNVKHRVDKNDPSKVYADVKSTARA